MVTDIRQLQLEKAYQSLKPICTGIDQNGEKIYKLGEKEIFRLFREYPLVASKVVQLFHSN